MSHTDVLIVGAGLAGLCCAKRLQAAGVSFLVVDAADRPGGRVRTDSTGGFLLDRGFQVLLTSYPEVQSQLDMEALDPRPFRAGVLVFADGEFYRVSDPWREPLAALSTAIAPLGTLGDKWRMARLRSELTHTTIDGIFLKPELPVRAALASRGFSDTMVRRFFQPLFGGMLLDHSLDASSRMFEFMFRMLALGRAVLPAHGMQAIPDQLAAALPPDSLRMETSVERLDGTVASLASGETIEARAVVVAADGWHASQLLGEPPALASRSVTCLYFAAAEPPVQLPVLVLNGTGRGLVNHLCVPSNVAPNYAPRGTALVSVSVVGQPALDRNALIGAVKRELRDWFAGAGSWMPLGVFRIANALPVVKPLRRNTGDWQIRPGVFACGDYRATPSIQGAMESGRLAAEAVLSSG